MGIAACEGTEQLPIKTATTYQAVAVGTFVTRVQFTSSMYAQGTEAVW